MSKWTPGPWAYLDIGEVVVDGDIEVTIAAIMAREDEEANGHLIAAAPDLAEALEDIIVRIEAWEKGVRSVIGGRVLEHGMDLTAARAALRRAKGEA